MINLETLLFTWKDYYSLGSMTFEFKNSRSLRPSSLLHNSILPTSKPYFQVNNRVAKLILFVRHVSKLTTLSPS